MTASVTPVRKIEVVPNGNSVTVKVTCERFGSEWIAYEDFPTLRAALINLQGFVDTVADGVA